MMPQDGTCPPFVDRNSDPYFTTERNLSLLLDIKTRRSLSGRIEHGYDPSSCVMAHI